MIDKKLPIKFIEFPVEWKRKIIGSINYYITYDYPSKPMLSKENLYQMWFEKRITFENGLFYFLSSEPFNPSRCVLSKQIVDEIEEQFYNTYDKYIRKY